MVAAKAKALGLDTLAQSVSIGFVIVFLIVLVLVLWLNKTTKAKLVGSIVAVGIFVLLPYWLLIYKSPAEAEVIAKQETARDEWKAKYNAAKPIFDKLCAEQSQPIINRVVEDVEGVLLLKVRPAIGKTPHQLWADQNWDGAALPMEPREDTGAAEYFLLDRDWDDQKAKNAGYPSSIVSSVRNRGTFGYLYVDVLSADGSQRTRITAKKEPGFRENPVPGVRFTKQEVNGPAPRYGVTYEDNVDPALRKHWIAGTTLKVIDTQSGETIAHQSFWRWDDGFGSTASARSPWPAARQHCPRIIATDPTYNFVASILKAKQGN